MAADPDHVSKLVRSVAPKVIDMDGVKKGLLCQLFGGVPKATGAPGGKGAIRCGF
jgi:DNA replicative helicase MCM subunit Mcm2 (Cdc46/Mcm family)